MESIVYSLEEFPFLGISKQFGDQRKLPGQTMRIFLKNVVAGTTYILDVDPTVTIQNVKAQIQHSYFISTEQQQLVFNGRELRNESTLSDHNIQNESTIQFINKQDKRDKLRLQHYHMIMNEFQRRELLISGYLRKNQQLSIMDIKPIIYEYHNVLFKWQTSMNDRCISTDGYFVESVDNLDPEQRNIVYMDYRVRYGFNAYSLYSYNSQNYGEISFKFKIRSEKKALIGIVPVNNIKFSESPTLFFKAAYSTWGRLFPYAWQGKLDYSGMNNYIEHASAVVDKYGYGDTVMIVIDFDALKCCFYKNGIEQGSVEISKDIDYKIAVGFFSFDGAIQYMP